MPDPITSTSAPSGMRARKTEWIAVASGSIKTATRSSMPSGTAHSCERWASIMRLHPPPVLEQNPVCNPGFKEPTVTRSHRPYSPAAQCSQRSAWSRAAHPSTDDSVTRCPAVMVAAVVEQLAHDLVSRHERHRDERREVERRLAGDRGQVAAADAGERRFRRAHPSRVGSGSAG